MLRFPGKQREDHVAADTTGEARVGRDRPTKLAEKKMSSGSGTSRLRVTKMKDLLEQSGEQETLTGVSESSSSWSCQIPAIEPPVHPIVSSSHHQHEHAPAHALVREQQQQPKRGRSRSQEREREKKHKLADVQ